MVDKNSAATTEAHKDVGGKIFMKEALTFCEMLSINSALCRLFLKQGKINIILKFCCKNSMGCVSKWLLFVSRFNVRNVIEI